MAGISIEASAVRRRAGQGFGAARAGARLVGEVAIGVIGPSSILLAIAVAADVKEVYPKTGRSGTMVFEVRRNTFRNQRGEVVAISEMSMVHRQAGGG